MTSNPPVARPWQKPKASHANGACLEVRQTEKREDGTWLVLVRDSKRPAGPTLAYTQKEWAAALDGIKRGEYDHLAGDELLPNPPCTHDLHPAATAVSQRCGHAWRSGAIAHTCVIARTLTHEQHRCQCGVAE